MKLRAGECFGAAGEGEGDGFGVGESVYVRGEAQAALEGVRAGLG